MEHRIHPQSITARFPKAELQVLQEQPTDSSGGSVMALGFLNDCCASLVTQSKFYWPLITTEKGVKPKR